MSYSICLRYAAVIRRMTDSRNHENLEALDKERGELHSRMAEAYGLDHQATKTVTDSMPTDMTVEGLAEWLDSKLSALAQGGHPDMPSASSIDFQIPATEDEAKALYNWAIVAYHDTYCSGSPVVEAFRKWLRKTWLADYNAGKRPWNEPTWEDPRPRWRSMLHDLDPNVIWEISGYGMEHLVGVDDPEWEEARLRRREWFWCLPAGTLNGVYDGLRDVPKYDRAARKTLRSRVLDILYKHGIGCGAKAN